MSQEDVEIVRRCFEAWARGDDAAALEFLAPDVVWKVAQGGPAQGPDAVQSVWQRWEADWDELEETPEEFVDAGDHVLVTVRHKGRGRGSGIEIAGRTFHVYTFRDGKILEVTERSEAPRSRGTAGVGRRSERESPAAGRALMKRLMGFEPTTFCMASIADENASGCVGMRYPASRHKSEPSPRPAPHSRANRARDVWATTGPHSQRVPQFK
jgi:uncharacterized protein